MGEVIGSRQSRAVDKGRGSACIQPQTQPAQLPATHRYVKLVGICMPGGRRRLDPRTALYPSPPKRHARTRPKQRPPILFGWVWGLVGAGQKRPVVNQPRPEHESPPNRGRSIDRSTSSSRPLILCDVGCVWRACLPLLAGSERTTILGSSSSIDLGRGRSIRTQSKRQPGVWFQATAQKPETQSKTACWRRPGPGRPARHVGDCSSGCPLRASNQGAPGAIFLLVARFFSISRRPGLRTRHPQESTQGYRLRLTQTWGGCMVACPFVGVEVSTPPPASCPGSGDR